MHRRLALRTREKVILYLERPPRAVANGDDAECGPWNTQEGIAHGAAVPLKHVSETLKGLERDKLLTRGRAVHVNGGRRVRRTYQLNEAGRALATTIALQYREREVRVVTPEGEVETRAVGQVLRGELDFHRYLAFVGSLDRWDRFDLRKPGA